MIKSLLIANRGEIACRIIRTAQRLAVRTIAVYSDADAEALHVRMADEALHIGPSPARESYLCGDKIIDAARRAGAEAIHPGYGFLSENADFAEAVIDAGLIWAGPKPNSIRAMGLKDAAKKLMAEAGVPVTPGYLGEDQDPQRLKKEADAIGYPVLIKAVAGGGGKGMRRVDEPDQFDAALESARREASSAFGDERVLIEKYILSPRHIEVQVFGDSHGNVVHLFERDCSLQRRHQKVIEEAPAPGMDEQTREAVCGAAVRAAKAVNYESAGTIEFIADASEGLKGDRIWFMEMNTRLQVEHPVTEEITGQDLVEWQLRIASGEPLPKTQDELTISGHAIEARLYAEDPARGFLPSVGMLRYFDLKGPRIETGVEQGDAISPFYDPMIAKIIVHGRDRSEAILELQGACATADIWPVKTNAGFLTKLLESTEFKEGASNTNFIDSHLTELATKAPISADALDAAAHLLIDPAPIELFQSGFRLNASSQRTMRLLVDGEAVELPVPSQRHRDEDYHLRAMLCDGKLIKFDQGYAYEVSLDHPRGSGATHGIHDGEVEAPMPGKVTAVDVTKGAKVSSGQRLLTLEAMKMEHALAAPFDGTVAELKASAGSQVTEGQLLVRIEPDRG